MRKENAKRYKSNASVILHNDALSPDVIAGITTPPEINSTICLNEAMFIGVVIIKIGDVVDVLTDTSTGKNIPAGTS